MKKLINLNEKLDNLPDDNEISKQLKQANVECYTIKYNSFTAVNSKWER